MSYWKQKTGTPKKKIISYDHYVDLSGSDYISTPDSPRNSVTGSIDIRIKISGNDWTGTSWQAMISKGSGVDWSYDFVFSSTGYLALYLSTDGTYYEAQNTAALSYVDGEIRWIRVTFNVNTQAVTFYDSTDENPNKTGWTQIDQRSFTAITSLNDSSGSINIGTFAGGEHFPSKVYYAEIRDGIDGEIVARFNASDTRDNGATFENIPLEQKWTNNDGSYYTDPNELIVKLQLNEGSGSVLNDSSGKNNNFTLTGGTWVTGQDIPNGTALQFNGTSDFARSVNFIDFNTEIVTITFWLWWDAFNGNNDIVCELTENFSLSGNKPSFLVIPNASEGPYFAATIWAGNNPTYDARSEYLTATPSAAVWHHYGIVLDNKASAGEIKIYVDGIDQATSFLYNDKSSASANYISEYIYLMARGGSTLFGAGKLSDFRIYNGELSVEKIVKIKENKL